MTPWAIERRNDRAREGAIVSALFVLAAVWAAWFVMHGDVAPRFYQHEFSPAVSIACGQGNEARAREVSTEILFEFLDGKTANFDCAQLRGSPRPLNAFQNVHLYLIGSVGFLWKLFGISWNSILPLYSFLGGITAAATYGIFRTCAGITVSAGATLLLMVSMLHRVNLPHLRDYAKAPFVLVVVLFLLWIVIKPLDRRRTLVIAGFTGLVLGVGIGFRMDLAMFAPVFVGTLLLFAPGGIRSNLVTKLSGCAVFVGVFLLVAYPVVQGIGEGGNAYHVILLGLMSPFDRALGLAPSLYEWGYLYNDGYVSDVVNSYARRSLGTDRILPIGTAAYDRAGFSYLATLAGNFPADMVTRYLASVVKVLQSATPDLLFGSYAGYFAVLRPVAIVTPWLCLAALAIIVARHPRVGIFGAFLVLFLCGYPSLQFQARHYFHLQAVPLWFLVFLAGQTFAAVRWRRSGIALVRTGDPVGIRTHVARAAVFACVAGIVLAGVPWSLRAWQHSHLVEYIRTIESAPSRPVPSRAFSEKGKMVFPLRDGGPQGSVSQPFLATNYWVADFDAARCGYDVVDFRVEYEASDPFFDASQNFTLVVAPRASYLFATYAFSLGDSGESIVRRRLRGVAMPGEVSPCLTGLREVTDLTHLPLLPSLLLRPGWERSPLFQRIGELHYDPSLRRLPTLVTSPPGNWVTQDEVRQMLSHGQPLHPSLATYRSPTVMLQGGGFEVDGPAWLPYSYLIVMPPKQLSRVGVLVAEGELFAGGLTIGLVRGERWTGQTNVDQPGRFVVAVQAEPGTYVATIANNLPGERFNHFKIEKIGWFEP